MKINKDKIVENTIELCKFKTVNPPGDEYLTVPILKEMMEEAGAVVKVFEKEKGRSNVVGSIKGKRKGKVVAIVGHLDVVPTEGQEWEINPFEPVVIDSRIVGRGSMDDKGPFVATIEGVRAFVEATNNDFAGEILLIGAADEERGSTYGVKYLFDEVGIKCDYGLIPDGGDWSDLVYAEMGVYGLNILSYGKAYHGSMPEMGFNSIYPIATIINKLTSYDWSIHKGKDDFDSVVINIGEIVGGTAPNIVPDKTVLRCMWRYPVGVKAEDIRVIVESIVHDTKNEILGSDFEIIQTELSIPLDGNPNGTLIELSQKTARELEMAIPKAKSIRAETVAKFIHQACGAEVIVNGPEDNSMDQMHCANESVSIESLENFANFYSHLLYNLLCQDKTSILN